MSPIPRDTPSLLVLGITFALLCCTVHAVVNDREERRNAGNDKGGNEQHYSSFPAHNNKQTSDKCIKMKNVRTRYAAGAEIICFSSVNMQTFNVLFFVAVLLHELAVLAVVVNTKAGLDTNTYPISTGK